MDAAHVGVQRPVERHPPDAVQRHLARLLPVLDPHPGIIEHMFVRSPSRLYSAALIRVDDDLPPSTHAPASGAADDLPLELLALLGLLFLNAFFVAAEYGLVTSRRTRIMELEHAGNRRARAVLRITATRRGSSRRCSSA